LSPWKSAYLPYLSVLCACLLWASSFIALKLAFRAYDPMLVIFGRMAIASLFVLIFLKPFRSLQLRSQDLKHLLFMGLCEPCLYFIFEAIALENTSASQAGMITTTMPLVVAVAAWLVLKEPLSWQTVLGFLLAIGGVVLLSGGSAITENAPHPLFGNFMEFLAMLAATGYVISMKRLSRHYSSLFITSFQAFIGSIFYFPLLFLPTTHWPNRFEPISAAAIVYLGLFVTFGAYGAYNYAVSKIPAARATAFINLIPVFTVIMGVTILDDRLTPVQYLAMAIVFVGIAISQYRPSGHRDKNGSR